MARKFGKRLRSVAEGINRDEALDLDVAVKMVKANATAKFDETIELAINLGVDPRHADQMVRGMVAWPHGTGKSVRVAVFAKDAKAEEAHAAFFADFLDLREMASGLGAGIVQVFERRARQFELARRLEADGAVVAPHRDDLAAFLDRLPAELAQRQQDVADAALFILGERALFIAAIDQFFVLGTDAPVGLRLLAALHRGDQLVAAFDNGVFSPRCFARAHDAWR